MFVIEARICNSFYCVTILQCILIGKEILEGRALSCILNRIFPFQCFLYCVAHCNFGIFDRFQPLFTSDL